MSQDTAEQTQLPPELFMDIDRSGPVPLYFQVAQRIEQAISDGTLPPGARLENEIALGERFGLSRPTVRRAMQDLVDKGLLVRRRGIGTQVVRRPVTRKVELTSLYDDLERSDKHPQTTLLSRLIVDADDHVADVLSIPPRSSVLHVLRLRLTDGVPLAVLENFLPGEYADFSEDDLTRRGLYQLMRARGTLISVAQQRIGARAATSKESRLLGIKDHGAVLTMERTAYDNNGRAVEYGRHCYRPDLYDFEITLVDK
ncbi:GntR family transcriptional regulator [Humibacter sp. RRB41]|uniref:GntR family transcriptional regulator n=1 Tax=Humibacter sp. RRB41 TaxID=2919946 RepID=UPI001FA9685C|nr:GntR family transcriptional regulator [Humibacter sp. RRB41]